MNRKERAWPALILVVALSITTARADRWYEYYAEAEKALKAENWSEAVEKLNLALEKRADSNVRARTYGMNVETYLPYFKLGIAYYHLEQLDAAAHAFETEERLGAIANSESNFEEMRRLRGLIEKARQDAADEKQQRIRHIVATNLAESQSQERQGHLDAALSALGRAVAVDPENPEIESEIRRLRRAVAQQQAKHDIDREVAKLVREGKALLDSQRLEEATARLERALSLRPSDDEAGALHDRAVRQLREQARSIRDSSDRSRLVTEGLNEARSLESTGAVADALIRLQSVLALDPGNSEAQALQSDLVDRQATSELKHAIQVRVQRLESSIVEQFKDTNFEGALSAANRMLALDAENTVARKYIARTYREISRQLLGTGRARNLPPAIRFADFREGQLEDGLQVEIVRRPDFKLAGSILDDAPVTLAFELLAFESSGGGDRTAERQDVLEGQSSEQELGDYFLQEFSLSHALQDELSLFRIVATDSGGLSSSSEYAVLYIRPFYRSAWPYAGLTIVALGAAALTFARRVRRRQRLLKRRFNPYMAGAPVMDPDLFFGRERLADRVLQRIHNNSLLLFGERRIGKTSLQHFLKRRLLQLDDPDYRFYPAYIDLQGTAQEQLFATMARELFDDLAPHLEGMELGPGPGGESPYSYHDFTADLRRALSALQRQNTKKVKVVMLIDEVDELNAYDPRINQKLRSLFMKSFADSLVTVVSGVAIKKEWESAGSPWYNFFEEIEVKPFARRDAEELIERPIRGIFKLEDGVVNRIISLTGCRPYLIQKLCIALVDRLHQEHKRRITVADVDAACPPEEV